MVSEIVHYKNVYKFQFAEATNTRMMGVVGVICHWQTDDEIKLTQIFHLDYESYGVDGYHAFVMRPGDDEINTEIQMTLRGVTGGLGGKFIEISFEQLLYLMVTAYEVDRASVEYLVDFEPMLPLLDRKIFNWDEVANTVLKKLTPDLPNDASIINYYMMRMIGCDYDAATFFVSDGGDVPDMIVPEPSTLIKNTIQIDEDNPYKYRVSAIVDDEDKYRLIVLEIKINDSHSGIETATIEESLSVSSIEASFNLNKPEYMLVIQVEDAFFERRFERNNPEFMKQSYVSGRLYMEFNPDNTHVNDTVYYLNGDLYAIYFFTDIGQLVVSSFSKENIDEINEVFQTGNAYQDSISLVCELKTDYPVIYSFAQSAYDNIFDFLEHFQF